MSELVDCINNLSAKDIIRSVAKTANGVPFYINTWGLGGFCSEYQTVYDAFSVQPSDDVAGEQNEMVCGWVSTGVWVGRDVIYIYAAHAAVDSFLNWKNPALFIATPNNAPTFTQFEGYRGNGSTMFIDWGWDPTADGVNYLQNTCNFGCYIRDNDNDSDYDMGCETGAIRSRIDVRAFGGSADGFINAGSGFSVVVPDSRGMFTVNRTGAAAYDVYRNKIVIVSDTDAATGIPNQNMYSLAANDDGVATQHSDRQMAMCFAGGEFANQTEVDNWYDYFQAYMTSNGKQV